MTNSEKYLKDGVDEKDFLCDYIDFKNDSKLGFDIDSLGLFLQAQATPTLTEDERVILRNLNEQIWEKIGRDKYGTLSLKTRTEDDENFFNGCYGHLFQFIKERRRIFY